MRDVTVSEDFKAGKLGKQVLLPILDVKTRWSSTHEMMRRAIRYRKQIDDFVGKHRELRHLDLDDDEWDGVILVAGWLKSFRTATTLMSTTKRPMLSYTHAIFRGLQDDLKTNLRDLPMATPSILRNGLLAAHEKLSDYYYKIDASPFYTWAALLDPRISSEGLKNDFAEDEELLTHLETSKLALDDYFKSNYLKFNLVSTTPAPAPASRPGGSPQK
ncbi:hypothetical protein C8F01DRAFT_1056364, partial [Mycena amicta]